MASARKFRLKFRAATLFLSTCSTPERVAKSGEQTAALKVVLSEGQHILQSEHDELAELVISTEKGWEASDRMSLLRALSQVVKKRRGEQKWSSALPGHLHEGGMGSLERSGS